VRILTESWRNSLNRQKDPIGITKSNTSELWRSNSTSTKVLVPTLTYTLYHDLFQPPTVSTTHNQPWSVPSTEHGLSNSGTPTLHPHRLWNGRELPSSPLVQLGPGTVEACKVGLTISYCCGRVVDTDIFVILFVFVPSPLLTQVRCSSSSLAGADTFPLSLPSGSASSSA
jgi:hypothetical protein